MPLAAPDPPLVDGGVGLRLPRDADSAWVTQACNDPETKRFVVNLPDPYTEAEARAFLALAGGRWAAGEAALFVVTEEPLGEPLGIVELHVGAQGSGTASIGYWLRPEGRGRGAATIAVLLVARWAFEQHGVQRLELTTAPDNTDSQGVAERAGFTREGILRAAMPTKGGRRDSVMFSLLPTDLSDEGRASGAVLSR